MKAKELKEILANVSDDAIVIVSNPQWRTTDIVGHQVVKKSTLYDGADVLYIDVKNFKR